MYFFHTNRYHAKEYDCVPKLTDAKRDIYHYMKSLCSSQEDANTDREKVSLASLESSERRGVIYTGGVNHLMKIYESIYGMMLLNISLPVEVWVNAEDQYFCARIIGRLARESERTDILCRTLSYSTMPQSKSSHMGISLRKSFMCKFLALLSTSFTDVIFIDADNLPVTAKVAGIFDSEEYKSTGAVIWPDIFGENCRETAVREKVVDPGITAWSSHCAWQAHMGGLSWYNQFKFAQEAETGQIALNLRRHGALIEFATVLMEHDFFRTVFYGDKDLFRFVFLLMEEPFYFVPQYPALSVYTPEPNSASSLRVDSLVQFFPSISASSAMAGSDASTRTPADFEPFFFHQLKLRNPEAFRRVLQVPAEVNTHPSACIQSSDCEIELPSHVSSASYAVGTSSGADTVNRTNQDIVVPARRLRTDYTLVESPASTRGYDSSPRNLASSLEKLHLRNLEKGDDYAHFAEKVFRKGDEEWKLINSTWFRFALILHKMYGIFQAIYYQLASFL